MTTMRIIILIAVSALAVFLLVLFLGCSPKNMSSQAANTERSAADSGFAKSPALTSLPAVIKDPKAYNKLTDKEANVLLHKGTERAFSGEYWNNHDAGIFICRQCNLPLFRSQDKFESGTGWPSFDDAVAGNVKVTADADGERDELLCANCGGHLGHVFYREGFTPKNARYCINSVSLRFVAQEAK
jgi:peptide-methionine (R)-S-oxide reductase